MFHLTLFLYFFILLSCPVDKCSAPAFLCIVGAIEVTIHVFVDVLDDDDEY